MRIACFGMSHLQRLTRGTAATIAVLLFLLGGVGYAAAFTYYYEGPYPNITKVAPWIAPLFESSARSLDSNTVCVAAYQNGSQVGSVACSDNLAAHPYDGVTWRSPSSRSTIGGYVVARARGDYN
jgi:hypothetical protein